MPTIVYLVHGMGCGTAGGKAPSAGQRWSDAAGDAVNWVADTFNIARPTVLDPIPDFPPAGSNRPDAVWLVPVTYHTVFDEFRRSAADRKEAMKGIGPKVLVDAQITALAEKDFAWVNCLDILLWWADTAQTRTRATANILSTIAKADQLARNVPGATIRRILVSHSLGNAAVTYALRHLATKPEWPAIGGFELWCSLANVAPFLIETADVYSPPLLPGRSGTLVQRMYNVRHEADPIPWLIPWRHWNPKHAGTDWGPAWAQQENVGNLRVFETQGVVAPTGRTPAVTDVHGFANYLMAPDVSRRLAAAMRGAAFSDAELATINLPGAWGRLPALTCTNKPSALADLKRATDDYIAALPTPTDEAKKTAAGWLDRLLRAADLLMAARDAC